jgi:transcriptional regulator with XRE-family HTH domain
MNDEDRKTAEEYVGANIKTRRAQLGLTQAQLAEAMQGLGHSWIQTTVAKTEAADRPLRVNEVADLARVLDVRVPELVSTDADWAVESINTTLAMHGAHANRLESEIEELNRQVAVKKQALEHGSVSRSCRPSSGGSVASVDKVTGGYRVRWRNRTASHAPRL